jgi:hypothetical protein
MRFISGVYPLRSLLAVTLCISVATTATLAAQSFEVNVVPSWTGGAGQVDKPAAPSQTLTVLVLQGQKAVNFIPDRRGTTPVVEVRDQNSLPIEGAAVVFTLPASGPGGLFSTGQRTATVRTNADGQAAAPFSVNGEAGRFQIQVAATFGRQVGTAIISQSNSLRAGEQTGEHAGRPWYRTWKLWALAGGVAAAAAVAIILATRGGSSSMPTITITPGSPTVSHP